jgi:glycosyltransferase involved in cell wall biosynthesis
MNDIELSIIIPIYNSEKYINNCINSIINQKGIKFEVLLIDDGSTDNSSQICDNYAQLDTRIKVFHKENGGVSSARNLGIENSRGKWITFIDSDDWLNSEYIQSINNILNLNIDLTIYNYISFLSKKRQEQGRFILQEGIHNDVNSLLNMALQLEIASLSTCTSIYKKEIIEKYHIRFDINMKTCEDFMFNLEYYSHIKSYYAFKTPYYYYRQNEESVTHKRKLDHAKDYQLVYNKLITITNKNHLSNNSIEIFKERWIKWIIGLVYNFKLQNISNDEINKWIYSQQYYNELKNFKVHSIKAKIEIILLKYKLNTLISVYCKGTDRVKKILKRYRL